MVNLLPLEEKQKLFLKKQERIVMILGIVVVISLICLILFLLSIKFYILAAVDSQKNLAEQNRIENQTSDSTNLSNVIQKYNNILTQLDSFYGNETYFNQVFQIISGVSSPEGLYLTNFSLDRESIGKIKISVSGVSGTRDSLLLFKKNVEENKKIVSPHFSAESWVSPKNVIFSLTFEINQNEK